MSVEHGHGHGGESVTSIISTLVLCFFSLGFVLDAVTDTLEELAKLKSSHGGH